MRGICLHADRGLDELLQFLKSFTVFVSNDWLIPLYIQDHSGSRSPETVDLPFEALDVLVGPA